MVFFVVSFFLMARTSAMEQSSHSLGISLASIAIAPHGALRDRWEALELTPEACRHPLVRGAMRTLIGALAVRGALQEAPDCVLDCQHQFCLRSYGCVTVPFGVLALVGLSADLPHVAKVSLGAVGSLGAMFASFVSLAHCARNYISEDEEFASSDIRGVIADIKSLLDARDGTEQV